MIRINLISAREVEEASSRKTELVFLGLGLAALLGALAWTYLSTQSELQEATVQVEKLENDVATIRKQNEEIERLEQQKRDTEKKLKVVRLLTSAERRSASVHILDDLSSSTPEYLWLTDFTEVKGSAKINGKAVDNQTIASFAHDLSRSKYFQKVEIRETAQEDPSDSRTRGSQTQQSGTNTPIPVKRFLIEAAINYLPTAEKQPASEAEAKGTASEKAPKRQGGE
jgi:Tfp pilus assembly protein PilN